MSESINENLRNQVTEEISPILPEETKTSLDSLSFLGSQPDAPIFTENPFEIKELKKTLTFTAAEMTEKTNFKLPLQYMFTALVTAALFGGALMLAAEMVSVKPMIKVLSNP